MKKATFLIFIFLTVTLTFFSAEERPRMREFGIETGIIKPGALNAITDVPGVKVGQVTLIQGDNIRTGVTAILPHEGNIYQSKVPGAIYVANGYGKLMGYTQVEELGNIETPIILTNTLSVPTAADAVIDYVLTQKGNESVGSVNALLSINSSVIFSTSSSLSKILHSGNFFPLPSLSSIIVIPSDTLLQPK